MPTRTYTIGRTLAELTERGRVRLRVQSPTRTADVYDLDLTRAATYDAVAARLQVAILATGIADGTTVTYATGSIRVTNASMDIRLSAAPQRVNEDQHVWAGYLVSDGVPYPDTRGLPPAVYDSGSWGEHVNNLGIAHLAGLGVKYHYLRAPFGNCDPYLAGYFEGGNSPVMIGVGSPRTLEGEAPDAVANFAAAFSSAMDAIKGLNGVCVAYIGTPAATFSTESPDVPQPSAVPATTGRKIYLSTAGDDSTGDGSQGNPYQTLAKGESLMRDLHDDHLYIKRNETRTEVFPAWTKSGADADHPMVIAGWGVGPRCKFNVPGGSDFFVAQNNISPTPKGDLQIRDLWVESQHNGHGTPVTGFKFEGRWQRVLRENLRVERFTANYSHAADINLNPATDQQYRFCTGRRAWWLDSNSNVQGSYNQGVTRLTFEMCLFDSNGVDGTGNTPVQAHDIYIQGHSPDQVGNSNCHDVAITGLIHARAPTSSLQLRSGIKGRFLVGFDNGFHGVCGSAENDTDIRYVLRIGTHDWAGVDPLGLGDQLGQQSSTNGTKGTIADGIYIGNGTIGSTDNIQALSTDEITRDARFLNCVVWKWKNGSGLGDAVYLRGTMDAVTITGCDLQQATGGGIINQTAAVTTITQAGNREYSTGGTPFTRLGTPMNQAAWAAATGDTSPPLAAVTYPHPDRQLRDYLIANGIVPGANNDEDIEIFINLALDAWDTINPLPAWLTPQAIYDYFAGNFGRAPVANGAAYAQEVSDARMLPWFDGSAGIDPSHLVSGSPVASIQVLQSLKSDGEVSLESHTLADPGLAIWQDGSYSYVSADYIADVVWNRADEYIPPLPARNFVTLTSYSQLADYSAHLAVCTQWLRRGWKVVDELFGNGLTDQQVQSLVALSWDTEPFSEGFMSAATVTIPVSGDPPAIGTTTGEGTTPISSDGDTLIPNVPGKVILLAMNGSGFIVDGGPPDGSPDGSIDGGGPGTPPDDALDGGSDAGTVSLEIHAVDATRPEHRWTWPPTQVQPVSDRIATGQLKVYGPFPECYGDEDGMIRCTWTNARNLTLAAFRLP